MIGGRKFVIVAGTLAAAFALALLGKLTADFATIAAVVVGSFNAAHMVQDYRAGSR